MNRNLISLLVSFVITFLIVASMGYGIAMAKWNLFPYEHLESTWRVYNETLIRPHFLSKARFHFSGAKLRKPEEIYSGYTLVTGIWKQGNQIELEARLIDVEGNVVHEWKVGQEELWSKLPKNKTQTSIHGTYLYPNGDLLLNLEYLSLVKIDKDSNLLWYTEFPTNHSIFKDDKNNFWIPGSHFRETPLKDYPFFTLPLSEDLIYQISPEGKILNTISILDVIFSSQYEGLLNTNESLNLSGNDPTHLNKIVVFTKETAKNFPLFEEGDILVSLRNIHTLLVIDKNSKKIKWSFTHPLVVQHDPILSNDGKILVYNNYMYSKDAPENVRNGSEILSIDPTTKKTDVFYKSTPENLFFSPWGGKHQILPNGNHLITESVPGRVFEINRNKEIVWEWVNSLWGKSDLISEILEGKRYSLDYLEFLNEKDSRYKK